MTGRSVQADNDLMDDQSIGEAWRHAIDLDSTIWSWLDHGFPDHDRIESL